MNTLRNNVQLIGNLGNDPQAYTFENGSKKATCSLATNEHYTDKEGERQERTQWHNIVFYGKKADFAIRFLRKGARVALQGKLASRSYENQQGELRYVTEIVAADTLMLDRKN